MSERPPGEVSRSSVMVGLAAAGVLLVVVVSIGLRVSTDTASPTPSSVTTTLIDSIPVHLPAEAFLEIVTEQIVDDHATVWLGTINERPAHAVSPSGHSALDLRVTLEDDLVGDSATPIVVSSLVVVRPEVQPWFDEIGYPLEVVMITNESGDVIWFSPLDTTRRVPDYVEPGVFELAYQLRALHGHPIVVPRSCDRITIERGDAPIETFVSYLDAWQECRTQ